MKVSCLALLLLAGCDSVFMVRPAGYVEGQWALLKQSNLEVRTEGIVGRPSALDISTLLDLRNASYSPMTIEEIDFVGVDGVALQGITQRAAPNQVSDPKPRSPGLETLPLTVPPGEEVRIDVRWRLTHELEMSCADRCTVVLKRSGDPSGEVRIDLLERVPPAPGAGSPR